MYNVTGDVLSAHLWFSEQTMAATQQLVPGANYFSIVRDPMRRFASAFSYYSIAGSVNKWYGCKRKVHTGPALRM